MMLLCVFISLLYLSCGMWYSILYCFPVSPTGRFCIQTILVKFIKFSFYYSSTVTVFSGLQSIWYLFTLLFVYFFAFLCVLFFLIHVCTSFRRMQVMLGCPSVRGTEERKHPKYVRAYARIKIRSVTFFFISFPMSLRNFFEGS